MNDGLHSIVGESPVWRRALTQARTVAASDATVLILGETGTGKDLIARAIHELSDRQQNKFVNLNCASIPTGLLESELFGHEKGAFTGAVSRKMGRMELADGGTLFLDEIGEVPLDIQPKLLRALQDREFERLGGTNTISVNVRMIVATNRHLADRVAKKLFRADLYYRINVFPIHLPALRERPADIPLLVRHFVEKAAIRLKRNPPEISPQVLDALNEWHWPGNVRELENFIERSILLSPGTILQSPIGELRTFQAHPRQAKSNENGTLEAVQRDRILRALRETRGVVAGSKGAAVRLAVKRSTLQSRIRKLGIKAEDYLS